MSPHLPSLPSPPSSHPDPRSTDTTNGAGRNRQVGNIFFRRFGGSRLALVAQALGEGGFERGNAFVQALVLRTRLLRHRLDRVELLALHDIEAIEDALRLRAHDAFDLLADAVGGARGVGDELAEFVEEPACRLRHRFRSMATHCNYGAAGAPPQAASVRAFGALTGKRLAVKAPPALTQNLAGVPCSFW